MVIQHKPLESNVIGSDIALILSYCFANIIDRIANESIPFNTSFKNNYSE
jgi:hypothetical protein